MLEKALFRKHTRLILYMAARQYFSQKELILWSLANNEFKDKDSIENKGQFRDKLISIGLLKKYTFKEFQNLYPNETTHACKAYAEPMERKRCMLEFDSGKLISLDYPDLSGVKLPFREYASEINDDLMGFYIPDIVKAFVFGCSMQRIIMFNEKLLADMNLIINSRPEISEELLPLVEKARETMENMVKKRIGK